MKCLFGDLYLQPYHKYLDKSSQIYTILPRLPMYSLILLPLPVQIKTEGDAFKIGFLSIITPM